MEGELTEGVAVEMHPTGERTGDSYYYSVTTAIRRSGLHGYTVRVRANHPDMSAKFVPGLICWADGARVADGAK
jgi:hypothetical protein